VPTYPAPLLDVLNHPQLSPTARLHALEALRHELPTEELLPLLLRLVSATEEPAWLRAEAIFALGYIGHPEAFGALVKLLDDPDPQLRAQGIRALHTSSEEPAALFPRMITALADPHPWVRDAACDAIGWMLQIDRLQEERFAQAPQLDVGAALTPLLACLQDDDLHVRQSAAYALGYTGAEGAREPLAALLQEQDDYLRARVLFALAQLRDDRALPAAAALLQERAPVASHELAIEAIGLLRAREALATLQRLLRKGKLRVAAAQALGVIGDPSAIPHLKKAMKSDKRRLREAAEEALRRIEG
jgi:HEAT repeat protein